MRTYSAELGPELHSLRDRLRFYCGGAIGWDVPVKDTYARQNPVKAAQDPRDYARHLRMVRLALSITKTEVATMNGTRAAEYDWVFVALGIAFAFIVAAMLGAFL